MFTRLRNRVLNGTRILLFPDMILPDDFYACPDVTYVAKQLLGKVLCTRIDGILTSGIISETEAYSGRNDKACHANNGKRTPRTEVMFGPPGHAYVYLCYGIHHLFNVVTNRKGLADAVLVRSVVPVDGLDIIKERRMISGEKSLTDGPGKLSEALGVKTTMSGHKLAKDPLWIEDRGINTDQNTVQQTTRIGVDYAGEDAKKPWRYTARFDL